MNKDDLEIELNKIIKQLQPNNRVRLHRNYTSIFINLIEDNTSKDNTVLALYKDWNKYKKRWDYHIEDLYVFCYGIHLYKQSNKGKFGQGKEKEIFK